MKIIGRVLQTAENKHTPELVAYVVSDKGTNYISQLYDVAVDAQSGLIENAVIVNNDIVGKDCDLDALQSYIVSGTFSLVPFENKIAESPNGRYLKRHYRV